VITSNIKIGVHEMLFGQLNNLLQYPDNMGNGLDAQSDMRDTLVL
jgi:hypothetical protein